AEAVENRAEDVVIVETVDQRFVHHHFVGYRSVDHALVQVGRAKPPNPTGKHHVMAVVDFGERIKGTGLPGKWQNVGPPVMLDADVGFFDIDVWRTVFAHRSQLDQVAFGPELVESEE